MNTEWFRQQLASRNLSQRGLAKLMELDPAAVSLMLRGQRKMTNAEAHQLSTILGVAISEVLRQAGVEVIDDVRRAPIAGFADDEGIVHLLPPGTHDIAVAPADCPEGTIAIQIRSPHSIKDGWLIFVGPNRMEGGAYMDQLCYVALPTGSQMIAMVRRGYKRGTHNLTVWPTNKTVTDTDVAWSTPVLWIKPD